MARRAAYPTVVLSLGSSSDGADWVVRELKTDASAIEDQLDDVAFIDPDDGPLPEQTATAFRHMLQKDRPRLIGFRLFAVLDATRGDVDWKGAVEKLTRILEHCKTHIEKGSRRHITRCTLFALSIDDHTTKAGWQTVTIPDDAFLNCVHFTTRHVARELTTHQQRTTCFNVIRMLLAESFGSLDTEQTLMPHHKHIQSWTVWMLTDEYEERRKKVQYRLAREEARYLRDAAISDKANDPFAENPVAEFCQTWADRDDFDGKHSSYQAAIEAMQDAAEQLGREEARPYNEPIDDYAWDRLERRLHVPEWAFKQVEDLKKARFHRLLAPYGAARVVEPWTETQKPTPKPPKSYLPKCHNIHLEPPKRDDVASIDRFSPNTTKAGIKTLRIRTGQYGAEIERANEEIEHSAIARRQRHKERYPARSEQALLNRFNAFQRNALQALASRPQRSAVGRIAYPIAMLIGLVAAFPLAILFKDWKRDPNIFNNAMNWNVVYSVPLDAITEGVRLMLTEPGVYVCVPLLVTFGLIVVVRMLVRRAEQDLQNLFGPGGQAERVFVHSVLELPAVDRPNMSTLGRVRNGLDEEIDAQVALVAGNQRRQLHLYRQRLAEVERRLVWLEQDGLAQHRTPGEAEADRSGTSRESGKVTLNFVRPPGASQHEWSLVPIPDQPTHTQLVGPWPKSEEKQDITFNPQGWPEELDIRDIDKIDAYMLYPERFLQRVHSEANRWVKPNVSETALSGNLGPSQTGQWQMFVLQNPHGRLKHQLDRLNSEIDRPVWGTPDGDANKVKARHLDIGDEGRLFLIHQAPAESCMQESS